jgi:hypothetical protein
MKAPGRLPGLDTKATTRSPLSRSRRHAGKPRQQARTAVPPCTAVVRHSLSKSVSLYSFFGYCLLVIAAILAVRVLVQVFRPNPG